MCSTRRQAVYMYILAPTEPRPKCNLGQKAPVRWTAVWLTATGIQTTVLVLSFWLATTLYNSAHDTLIITHRRCCGLRRWVYMRDFRDNLRDFNAKAYFRFTGTVPKPWVKNSRVQSMSLFFGLDFKATRLPSVIRISLRFHLFPAVLMMLLKKQAPHNRIPLAIPVIHRLCPTTPESPSHKCSSKHTATLAFFLSFFFLKEREGERENWAGQVSVHAAEPEI